jgi:glycosyltransferase involved in cell wall biosynthesis
MRVAIVMRHHYLDTLGGAEIQAHLIARVLQDHGHVVRFVALRGTAAGDEASVAVDPSGVEVVRLPWAGADADGESALRRELQAFAPDVCYTRTFSDVAMILRVCRQVPVPCIYHLSSDDQCSAMPRWVTWRSYRPGHIAAHIVAYRAVKRWASVVVCQSEDQRRRLVGPDRALDARTRVIANMWPGPLQTTDVAGNSVIWIANLKRVKRPELFLRLARELEVDRSLDFVMIGQASGGRLDIEVARAGDSGQVRYLGPLSLRDTEAQLRHAALLVNTSKVEGFPNTFLQAFALGVPVISLAVDPDGILNGTGLGLRSGTYRQMVDDVRRVLSDRALAASMAECGRRYFAANHALGKVGPSYVRLFEQAAGLASGATGGDPG